MPDMTLTGVTAALCLQKVTLVHIFQILTNCVPAFIVQKAIKLE